MLRCSKFVQSHCWWVALFLGLIGAGVAVMLARNDPYLAGAVADVLLTSRNLRWIALIGLCVFFFTRERVGEFTLIELLIVFAVIGIFVSLLFPEARMVRE